MAKATKTPKYRIYELEKELNQDSAAIIEFLKKHKVRVANRFSAVDEETYNFLKENFARRAKPAKEQAQTSTDKSAATPANATTTKPEKSAKSKFDSKHVKPKYDSKPKTVKPTPQPVEKTVEPKIETVTPKVEEPPKVEPKVESKIESKVESKVEPVI